jgi:hypothetical protein
MVAPIIKFVSIIGRTVSAIYLFLPIGSQVVLVDNTSGKSIADPNAKAEGSSGWLSIELPEVFLAGAYHLVAVDNPGARLAESVQFYVA